MMVMYAPRKYTLVGNEPCVAGVENSLPQTSDSPMALGEHLTARDTFLLGRHKTETQNLF